jgi:hypothetical protein
VYFAVFRIKFISAAVSLCVIHFLCISLVLYSFPSQFSIPLFISFILGSLFSSFRHSFCACAESLVGVVHEMRRTQHAITHSSTKLGQQSLTAVSTTEAPSRGTNVCDHGVNKQTVDHCRCLCKCYELTG